MPAVLFEIGVVDADLGAARHEALRGLPVRHRGAVQIGDIALGQVLGIGHVVVVPQQRLGDREGRLGQAGPRELHQIGQSLFDAFFAVRLHDLSSGEAAVRRFGAMRRAQSQGEASAGACS